MGNRGAQPQPYAVLKAKGTLNVTRTKDDIANNNASALQWVHEKLPDAPDDLTDVGRKIWMTQLSQAQNLYGYISFIDLCLFHEYCLVYQEMQEIRALKPSRWYLDEKGVKKPDPDYSMLQDLRKDFMRLSREFGFSPSARTAIKLQSKIETEEEEQYDL